MLMMHTYSQRGGLESNPSPPLLFCISVLRSVLVDRLALTGLKIVNKSTIAGAGLCPAVLAEGQAAVTGCGRSSVTGIIRETNGRKNTNESEHKS